MSLGEGGFTISQLSAKYHLPENIVSRVLLTDDSTKWHVILNWLANLGEGMISDSAYAHEISMDVSKLPKRFPEQLFP